MDNFIYTIINNTQTQTERGKETAKANN